MNKKVHLASFEVLVIKALRRNRGGMTINQLSEAVHLHRHTTRKYLDILVKNKFLVVKELGRCKLHDLRRRF